jgi:enoyl-CoA hydratase/carnithine racemase
MERELVVRTTEDGLCTLALNRPEKLNALNVETFRQLDAHLKAVDPAEVGCVLLTGNGRSFCAGHDLDDLASGAEGLDAARFETNVIEHLATLPMPVVAAVRGHCYTGGLELVLGADIIIASENARFADTHAKWDLVPVWGLSQRLPRRIGPHKAKEMMFSARAYSGAQAAEMGLANFCLPDDAFDEGVKAFCADILANSRRSARAIKKLMLDTEGMSLAQGIAWELHRSEGHGPEFAARLAKLR